MQRICISALRQRQWGQPASFRPLIARAHPAISSALAPRCRPYSTRDAEAVQPAVPRLKLNDLRSTCDRFLRVVEPIVSEEAFAETKQQVQEFLKSGGPELQKDLERLNEDNKEGSWVSGLWETMYLEYRAPLPIHTNPFFVLDPIEGYDDQILTLANLIRATALFHHKVRAGELPPVVQGNSTLCDYQYPRLLASTRIPGAARDRYESYPGSNHVVVMAGGHMYAFHVLNDDGDVISLEECQQMIMRGAKKCISASMENPTIGMVPSLTALDRTSWAHIRNQLEKDEKNESILKTIDSAIAVFALSDNPGDDLDSACRDMLHPIPGWFDKLQLIVMRNGQIGINMEHTAVDGHSLLRFIADVREQIQNGVPSSTFNLPPKTRPHVLEWSPATAEVVNENQKLLEDLEDQSLNVDQKLVLYRGCGKDWLKTVKVSPDAFVQLCFHLAHYRITNRVASTYESVMMKHFLRGRTETGRTMTSEAKAFVQVMSDPLALPDIKEAAFRAAADAHVAQIQQCQAGDGVDRHLFGLKQMAAQRLQRMDGFVVPSIFSSEAYTTMSTNILSTSNCGMDGLAAFGFGPVTEEGYGLGYMIARESIMVYVTSFAETNELGGAELFASHLEKAFADMHVILSRSG